MLVVRVDEIELEDKLLELVVEDCGVDVEDEDDVIFWLVLTEELPLPLT